MISALLFYPAKSQTHRFLSITSKYSIPIVYAPNGASVATARVADVSAKGVSIPHLYSPLHDPPPVATPDNIKKWQKNLINRVSGWLKPDLKGRPVSAIYAELTERANQGNSTAALQLYVDLSFCNRQAPPNSRQFADQEIQQDEQAHKEGWADQLRETYSFCAGLTQSQRSKAASWLWLSAQQGNLDAQAQASEESWPTANQQQVKNWLYNAASHGVPLAWNYLSSSYIGVGPHAGDPLKVYASMATLYLLTQSQAVAYGMWQLSMGQLGPGLSPEQIGAAEQLAREQYIQIQSVLAGASVPSRASGDLGE